MKKLNSVVTGIIKFGCGCCDTKCGYCGQGYWGAGPNFCKACGYPKTGKLGINKENRSKDK